MSTYHIYGLHLRSELDLPGVPLSDGEPDAELLIQPLDDAELEREGSRGGRVWGRIYNDIQFLVEDGRRIVMDVRSALPEKEVRGYALGVLMSALLRQRGFLVLHACCVARDGESIAFVGESGWGKSTLAEYFCQQNYQLVTDDVLVLDTRGASVQAIPAYPHIRLREDTGTWLREDFHSLPSETARPGKRISTARAFADASVPLSHLYLLDPSSASANRIERIPAREAVLALLSHTRATNLVHDAEYAPQLLQQCTNLVRSVAVRRLHRIRQLEQLSAVKTLVEQDVRAAVAVLPGGFDDAES